MVMIGQGTYQYNNKPLPISKFEEIISAPLDEMVKYVDGELGFATKFRLEKGI